MLTPREFWLTAKDAGTGFVRHKITKLSASLCFFTMFSIGPVFLIVIYISGVVFGLKAAEGTLYIHIRDFIGKEAAQQVQQLIKNAFVLKNHFWVVFSLVALLFAATTAFNEIHNSINTIWNLRIRKGRGIKQMLKTRLVSFILISGMGVLFFIFLLTSSFFEGFMHNIKTFWPQFSATFFYLLNILILWINVALLFAMIYKILPDAHIRWKDVIAGAIVSSFLFMFGKFGFTFYIRHSHLTSSFGSAGSFVVLLVWIYYSATMLYFGAEFAKAYAIRFGDDIKPKEYAVTIKVIEIESNETSIQQNEKSTESLEKDMKKQIRENKGKKLKDRSKP